jgi:hypothetical protein
MTEEERKRLIARFRAHEVVMWTDVDLAADEIERLERENRELQEHLDWLDSVALGKPS